MFTRTLPLLCGLTLACSLTLACDKADDKKTAKTDDKNADASKDDAEKAGAAKQAEPAPEPEATPEEPPAPAPAVMEPLAIADWGVTLNVPAGSTLGEVEAGDGMADTANIDAESGCGVELELYRHAKTKTIVKEMFDNAMSPSGNKDDQYPVSTQTDEGYEVTHSWVIPLGDTMWSAEVGKVLGDHLVMCGAGGLGGVEKAQDDCALKACQSLALAAGAG